MATSTVSFWKITSPTRGSRLLFIIELGSRPMLLIIPLAMLVIAIIIIILSA